MKRSKKAKSKAMVRLGAKGGLARAENLSAAERKEIARKAAAERWAAIKGLPKETHTGILKLGEGVPCSVLDNDMRVFTVGGLERAFESGAKGRKTSDEKTPPLPSFLAAANVRPFISDDLMQQLTHPIEYRSMKTGRTGLGYEATILRKMCDALLDARAAGVLRLSQLGTARAAEMLVRAFADVGIIALIDEATGFQFDRASQELRRLVEAYVVEDMRPWAKLFPDSFFKQVYKIHGWQYKPGVTQGPRYVGKFINRYVYSRLPTRVVEKLRELNPSINNRRKYQHHRFLTEDIGEPTVDRHLASVITLMTVATDKKQFDDMFKVAFPALGEQMIMGSILNPSLPGATAEAAQDDGVVDSEIDAEESEAIEPDGPQVVAGTDGVAIELTDAVGGVRERIIAAMQGRDRIKSTELAQLVYGDSSEPTMSKLRVRLGQYKDQGIVETVARGYWRLR